MSNDEMTRAPDGECPFLSSEFLLDTISEGVLVVARDWRLVYLNRRARDEIARGREFVGQDFWQAFPGTFDHFFGRMYRQCMSDRDARAGEAYFAPLGHWFSTRAVPVPVGLAIFYRIVTEEKQRDSALRASEARLKAVFSSLTVGIVVHDRSGAIVDINPAAEDVLGVSRADVLGLTSDSPNWGGVDNEGRPLPGSLHPAMVALRTGQVVRNFVMGVHNPRLNERRWLSVDASPIWETGSREASHACAIFTDITERRRVDYELHQSRLFMSVAQRVTSIGSAAIDFRTGKWNWSDETYRIYGVDKNRFKPSFASLAELVHPDDRERLLSAPELALEGVTPPPLEYRIIRPDGAERILRREAALIVEPDGQVTGIVGSVQDVTDIRAAARERERLQMQLNHAQRLDALGTLAGGIAHDLNNVLVPVVALSEVIEKSLPDGDKRRPMIELIRRSGERGRNLVGQVLAFTRRERPNVQSVDLTVFLARTMQLIRASIPTTIEIVEKIGCVRPLMADPGQLDQVFINLFTNAAQAIGDRSGKIELTLKEVPAKSIDSSLADADYYALISVEDDGCGMDEHVQARIFEPFFTTKRVGMGTGLGLAVAHGIVTAHGGKIVVASRPGEGARFDVYLPIAR